MQSIKHMQIGKEIHQFKKKKGHQIQEFHFLKS